MSRPVISADPKLLLIVPRAPVAPPDDTSPRTVLPAAPDKPKGEAWWANPKTVAATQGALTPVRATTPSRLTTQSVKDAVRAALPADVGALSPDELDTAVSTFASQVNALSTRIASSEPAALRQSTMRALHDSVTRQVQRLGRHSTLADSDNPWLALAKGHGIAPSMTPHDVINDGLSLDDLEDPNHPFAAYRPGDVTSLPYFLDVEPSPEEAPPAARDVMTELFGDAPNNADVFETHTADHNFRGQNLFGVPVINPDNIAAAENGDTTAVSNKTDAIVANELAHGLMYNEFGTLSAADEAKLAAHPEFPGVSYRHVDELVSDAVSAAVYEDPIHEMLDRSDPAYALTRVVTERFLRRRGVSTPDIKAMRGLRKDALQQRLRAVLADDYDAAITDYRAYLRQKTGAILSYLRQ